jgi:hypothetical protein
VFFSNFIMLFIRMTCSKRIVFVYGPPRNKNRVYWILDKSRLCRKRAKDIAPY